MKGLMIIKMDKEMHYVAVDKNGTRRSIKSGTRKIAQTYICIYMEIYGRNLQCNYKRQTLLKK